MSDTPAFDTGPGAPSIRAQLAAMLAEPVPAAMAPAPRPPADQSQKPNLWRGYRCGWRWTLDRFAEPYFDMVVIRRGEFTANLAAEMFDDITDENFAHLMVSAYREKAFEHLEADLDALAPLGRLLLDGDIYAWTDNPPPREAIKAAVERWEAIRADREPAA